ncbi:hypothetical protein EX895_001562 [Sporisorium graminicola]|uniref:Ras modification protein ERF4 n=1 Tax=Sporisorium graminicola TaxID=280036 RepID=A0A4U7KWF4_9BASI|nr:hypothetical protein EX895_001562 [Sporisorium graminicola]TKY89031.1 hypothetical protein EX895_001562 [Sporisorium graminicola]
MQSLIHRSHNNDALDASAVLPPPLDKPVVIPQRRQADRLRGFQLLYAPALADSGVSEPQFIAFLSELNEAIGFDTRVKLFNFGVDVGAMAVGSWEMLVAVVATQALTTTAAHVGSRVKSEACVARANQGLFHPRGLHAQIVPVSSGCFANSFSENEPAAGDTQSSSFQFSLGSPNVLPETDPRARGALFNLNKRPIDYDPFDYGPGYLRLRPDQYAPLRPSQHREPVSNLMDRAAAKVEKYNVWKDRLPAKKNARRQRKQQEKVEAIRSEQGEAGVERFLQQQQQQQGTDKEKSKLAKFMDRNKVVLLVTNLDERDRAQIQDTLTLAANRG